MLAGAALVPSAPLLLPSVTPVLPEEVAPVRAALRDALARLPDADVVLLLAAADQAGHAGVHGAARAGLAGIGRGDVTGDLPVPRRAVRALTEASVGLGPLAGPLPLDLAVLALHLQRPVVPVAVDPAADGDELARIGRALAEAVAATSLTAALVAAGDGSAGLSACAPRPQATGAAAWQDSFEAGLGDPDALASLGPAEAARVVARGWAPAVVASSACAAAGLRLAVTLRAAPRGVGYLVATTHEQ